VRRLASIAALLVVAGRTPAQQLQLRADARLVLVPATVMDDRQRPVDGLLRENFRLFDDGVEQAIAHFDADDAPFALGIVLDASASMRRTAPLAPRAMTELLEKAQKEDEFFLVEFSNQARLVTRLTHDAQEIVRSLARSNPEGRTALFDAILLALREIREAASPRRALLVVTDGLDNQSGLTSAQIERVIRESAVPIYTLAVVSRGLRTADLMAIEWLRRTAVQTGGRKYESRAGDLSEYVRQISRDLRSQYVLGFSSGRADGRDHDLRVEVTPPAGARKPRAISRPAYFAPAM
jgi:Ca-activated chloride channel family protein